MLSIEYPSECRVETRTYHFLSANIQTGSNKNPTKMRRKMYKFLLVFVFFTLLNVFMEKYLYLNDDKNENTHKRTWT